MNLYIQKLTEYINEINIGDKAKIIVNDRVAAAGVVYKIGENGEKMVLLIQRAKDDHWPLHWEFPRGGCDKPIGEASTKCAMREVKEETGLDVELEGFLGKFEYLAKGGTQRTTCYNYLCKMKNPDQKIVLKKNPESGVLEHEAYKWITQIGEAELLLFPDQKKIIEKVLSVDNPISVTPSNIFTKNDTIEEYLNGIQKDKNDNSKD